MEPGVVVLIVAVAGALTFGTYRAMTDGRFRGTHRVRRAEGVERSTPEGSVLAGTPWESELGERATLLQFSSAFCAPCRATRRILADVAATEDGVTHLEVDAEHHLELVRALGILRTPTTLILDADGREVTRAVGAPTKPQVIGALEAAEAG